MRRAVQVGLDEEEVRQAIEIAQRIKDTSADRAEKLVDRALGKAAGPV